MLTFDGKVVIITGAGKEIGIGFTTAKKLAQLGAQVICTDVDEPNWKDDTILFKKLDVTDEKQVGHFMQAVAQQYGHIDILINNAGLVRATKLAQITLQEYEQVFDVNMKGTFLCTKLVLPFMKKAASGRIITIGSVSAKQGGGHFAGPHYAASKAAVSAFTKAIAKEVAPYQITANVVIPGLIFTRMTETVFENVELHDKLVQAIPLQRAGTASDVAQTIVFLASDAAAYITAEDIDVNGGSYID